MATTELNNIFLSASLPLPERDPKYFKSADLIAIRDAVIALATIAIPKCRLVWGGHPSITPLIYYVLLKLNINVQEHVSLFQSRYFEKYFPDDNNKFKNVTLTENSGDRESSIRLMRETMFCSYEFKAGIFIGGMDGVEEEYNMFKNFQPEALLLPIASTGAAAKLIYDNHQENFDVQFETNYAYMSLFQNCLIDKIF